MARRLENKTALVLGGGRGIGRAVALLMAEEGAQVVVNDLGCEVDGTGSSRLPADSVVEEIQAARQRAQASYADVSTLEGAEQTVKAAIDAFGRLDILVNSTGLAGEQTIADVSEEEWNTLCVRQLKANFAPVKFASILFRQQQSGRIVLMMSDAGLGLSGQTAMAAVGEGIVGFTRTVARDLGRYGVTVNAIAPVARTRLHPKGLHVPVWGAEEAFDRAGLGAPSPTETWSGPGSPDDPENVAPFAVWLCTGPAADVNGNVFRVRGGDIHLYSHPVVEKSIATYKRLSLDQILELVPRAFVAASGL